MGPASDRIGRLGVYGVASLVVGELGWKFREQFESDYGVDAIIESAENDQPTGHLIALQIKSGDARLAQLHRDGRWTMHGEKRRALQWLEKAIPVLVVLSDPARRIAYWQHVNEQTIRWTPGGFCLDVPEEQHLDGRSAEILHAVADRWVPQRPTTRSRALRMIAECNAAGVPVPPTEQLWDFFVGEQPAHAPGLRSTVRTYQLPLQGHAPAVESLAQPQASATVLSMKELRGLWSVPSGTTVFVCENQLIVSAAVAAIGPSCKPLVELGGFPSLAVEYLMIGLAASGAHLRVHVDHDETGSHIMRSLFARSVRFEQWCPNVAGDRRFEEDCLPEILHDLAGN